MRTGIVSVGNWKKYATAFLFLVPALLLIFSIKYYAFFMAIVESFFDWNAVNVNNFIGLANFRELLDDSKVIAAFVNVTIYSLANLAINLSMPLLAAILVFRIQGERFRGFLKAGLVIPMVVPGMVVILLWRWIYQGDDGILNTFLSTIGLQSLTHSWLAEPGTALASLIMVGFPWIAGLPFLLYLAGLMSIPTELFEVAKIDGVQGFKRFVSIELPMIASQFKLVFIYVLINSFQVFELPYALTSGGPGYATMFPALALYDQAFNYSRFGYASSIGVVLFALVLVITLINQTFLKGTESSD